MQTDSSRVVEDKVSSQALCQDCLEFFCLRLAERLPTSWSGQAGMFARKASAHAEACAEVGTPSVVMDEIHS